MTPTRVGSSKSNRAFRWAHGCRAWILAIAAFALLEAPKGALAQSSSSAPKPEAQPAKDAFFVEIMVLHATNSKKGIDARIGTMPELAKPPFSSYDSYELLERARLPLEQTSPRTLKLPNGRLLETRLLQVLAKDVVRLSASINQPNGKEFLPLLEVKAKLGQAFIVAGQSHQQGILVLVIRAAK